MSRLSQECSPSEMLEIRLAFCSRINWLQQMLQLGNDCSREYWQGAMDTAVQAAKDLGVYTPREHEAKY